MAKKSKEEIESEMNEATMYAMQELHDCKTADDVAKWFGRWSMKAGYKRLTRGLCAFHGVMFESNGKFAVEA